MAVFFSFVRDKNSVAWPFFHSNSIAICCHYRSLPIINSPLMTSPDPKPVKTNQKGEVISWDSKSPDGKLLKLLVSDGRTVGKTPSQLMKDFPQFKKYNCKALSSALNNLRKSFEGEVKAARSGRSSCKCHVCLFGFALESF
jgi:hypothetical protein